MDKTPSLKALADLYVKIATIKDLTADVKRRLDDLKHASQNSPILPGNVVERRALELMAADYDSIFESCVMEAAEQTRRLEHEYKIDAANEISQTLTQIIADHTPRRAKP